MDRIVLSESKIGHRLSREDALYLLEKSIQNPLFFAENILGAKLWSKQRVILKALWENQRVAVKSGHAVGKSYLAAAAVLTYIHTHYPSIVITTAPVARQVQHVLWREIAKLYNQAKIPLGGELLSMTYRLDETTFAIGIATDDPEKIQGFHSENILVVVDEAAGIDDAIMDSIESIMAGGNTRLLMLGNPSRLEGHFYRAFMDKTESQLYKKYTISAFDTPNVVHKKIIIPGLVTWDWVEQRKKIWGPDHPLYKIRVLGEFPQQQFSDLVIPPFLLDIARENEIPVKIIGRGSPPQPPLYGIYNMYNYNKNKSPSVYNKSLLEKEKDKEIYKSLGGEWGERLEGRGERGGIFGKYLAHRKTGEWVVGSIAVADRYILGIDVGEYGESETAVAIRLGPKLINVYAWSVGELVVQITKIQEIINIFAKANIPIEIRIDNVGVGYGLYEALKEYASRTGGRVTVYGVDVRERPIHPEIYFDTRSEAWMEFRNMLANKEVDMTEYDRAGFEPEVLYAQLTLPRYYVEDKGRIRIETARGLRQRGIRRLDRATAVVLAFYDAYMQRARVLTPPNPVYFEGVLRPGQEEEAPWRMPW